MLQKVLFLASLLLLATAAFGVPLHKAAKDTVPDQYIVVFKTASTQAERDAHMLKFNSLIQFEEDAELLHSYSIGTSFFGYSGRFSSSVLEKLMSEDSIIDYIETDQIMRTTQSTCFLQRDATWGLDRINNRQLVLDDTFTYQQTSTSVDAFIVDTGIYVENVDFGGRAVFGANYVNDGQNGDCNGHGTHVAGTVGGNLYGVAKDVTLIGVKVLGCDGSGTNAGVIAGVNYVAANKKNGKPAVANMSLGGGLSSALNNAVNAAVQAGVFFAVAAGNNNGDACNGSPSSAAEATCVGATTIAPSGTTEIDQRASFSNYGTCVKIFAPGQQITSAWIGSPNAIETISGTSMASPHVCGAGAVILTHEPEATPAQITAALSGNATDSIISLACGIIGREKCNASPNKLLYVPCE